MLAVVGRHLRAAPLTNFFGQIGRARRAGRWAVAYAPRTLFFCGCLRTGSIGLHNELLGIRPEPRTATGPALTRFRWQHVLHDGARNSLGRSAPDLDLQQRLQAPALWVGSYG